MGPASRPEPAEAARCPALDSCSQADHQEVQSNMGIHESIDEGLRGIEKLGLKIPGFKGYKEKELRREADKILRTQLADELKDQRRRLSGLQMQLISQVQIEFLDDLERAVMKLQILTDKINTASYGYAGLFDAVKVKEEQLDALYNFDNRMFDYVDDISAGIDKVASAISVKEGVGLAIAELVVLVEEATLTFGHRDEAILQAGGEVEVEEE
jgi:hypothetical protein